MKIKNKSEILNEIEAAFSECRRPLQFIDTAHCEESIEHNKTLSQTSKDDIGLKELGNPGWDPLCFVNPDGFVYYFPSMVRLLFDETANDQYLAQFLFHCTFNDVHSQNFCKFSPEQTKATANLMRFIKFNWKKKLEKHTLTNDLEKAVNLWSNKVLEGRC